MTRKSTMVGQGGLWAANAQSLNGSVADTLTAAGTTQADAYAVTADVSVFTTVASGAGARLQANLETGDSVVVANVGANALLLYPPVGGYLNAAAQNAAVSVAAGKVATVVARSATKAVVTVGA